jgi:hypothetical protein
VDVMPKKQLWTIYNWILLWFFFLSNQNFKNQCLYDLFVLNVCTNCETLYVFASFINQNSKKHDFETLKDFEEPIKKTQERLKTLKGLETCEDFLGFSLYRCWRL